MFDVKDKPRVVERTCLVRVYTDRRKEAEAHDLIDELEELVSTLKLPVLDKIVIRVPKYQASLLVGSGKAEELKTHVLANKYDCIIFDNELSPAQQRNWEALTDITTIDRQEIILDIFASRAATKEAKLQVELARMEYIVPRLKRHWTHLSRQGGAGPAAKGEGEKQIEIDRRLVRAKIDTLKRDLNEVRKTRANQRKERLRTPVPTAAIVGYTNAGKSSLLRSLTGADILVADKLFATLDPTTRKVRLPNGAPLLLTDTVGFVRNLPHRLVEAFKATLEEAVLANFLVHVLDAGHPQVEAFHKTTLAVLGELGAADKKILTVFNKIDTLPDASTLATLRNGHPDAIFMSVLTGEGQDVLMARMADLLADTMVMVHLHLPHSEGRMVSLIHEHGRVCASKYEDDYISVQAMVPTRMHAKFLPFVLESPTSSSTPRGAPTSSSVPVNRTTVDPPPGD